MVSFFTSPPTKTGGKHERLWKLLTNDQDLPMAFWEKSFPCINRCFFLFTTSQITAMRIHGNREIIFKHKLSLLCLRGQSVLPTVDGIITVVNSNLHNSISVLKTIINILYPCKKKKENTVT